MPAILRPQPGIAFMSAPDSLKSIPYAFFANLSIAVAKGFTPLYKGCGAMLAETIYSLPDAGNQLLLWESAGCSLNLMSQIKTA